MSWGKIFYESIAGFLTQASGDRFTEIKDEAKQSLAAPHFTVPSSFFILMCGIAYGISTVILALKSPTPISDIKSDLNECLPLKQNGYYYVNVKTLIPKSDQEIYLSATGESAQFSKSKWNYSSIYGLTECSDRLGPQGANVCSSTMRQDKILGIAGTAANNSFCLDLVLSWGYRFCVWNQGEDSVAADRCTVFPTVASMASSSSPTTYFFSNQSGVQYIVTAPFLPPSVISDFVTDKDSNVYVVAVPQGSPGHKLYKLSPMATTATYLCDVDSMYVHGLAASSTSVFIYSLDQTGVGTVLTYKFHDKSVARVTLDCSLHYQPLTNAVPTSLTRWLDYGDDGNVYVMCSADAATTISVSPTTFATSPFSFYQLNSESLNVKKIFYTDLLSQNVTKVAQIIVTAGSAYLLTSANNLVRVDLSSQPTSQPTIAPTMRTKPLISFNSSVTLSGLSASSVNSAVKAAVARAAAVTMGLSTGNVQWVGYTLTSNRRLRVDGRPQSLFLSKCLLLLLCLCACVCVYSCMHVDFVYHHLSDDHPVCIFA